MWSSAQINPTHPSSNSPAVSPQSDRGQTRRVGRNGEEKILSGKQLRPGHESEMIHVTDNCR